MAEKVLITGMNGFLGAALWKYTKVARPSAQLFGTGRHVSVSSRHVFLCRLNNPKEILEVISRLRPDYIFHLTGGRVNVDNDLLRDNVLTTKLLLEAVTTIKNYRPRVIIPGSAAEYGRTTPAIKPVRETVSARPVSFYGFIKYTQTNLALMYARAGLDVVVARIFNVCGYGTPSTLSLGQFSRQIVLIERGKKKPVIETRNLGMKRDFLDVQDVCSALWAVAQRGKAGEVYNVCSGKAFVMRELLKKLIGQARVKNIMIRENNRVASGVDVSVGSNAKIKMVTGWNPKVDIDQSLADTFNYYQTSERIT